MVAVLGPITVALGPLASALGHLAFSCRSARPGKARGPNLTLHIHTNMLKKTKDQWKTDNFLKNDFKRPPPRSQMSYTEHMVKVRNVAAARCPFFVLDTAPVTESALT